MFVSAIREEQLKPIDKRPALMLSITSVECSGLLTYSLSHIGAKLNA